MHVHVAPLTPATLNQCAPFWGGLTSYHPRERQHVFAAASTLLQEQRAFGAIVMEDGRPRAFGITAFAHEAFVNAYLDDPHPQVGKRLLLDAFGGGALVLTCDQLGERNAGSGGQLIIINCGWNPHGPDPELIFGRVVGAMLDTHRGHRIARVLNESFGRQDVALLMNSEYQIRRVFEEIAPGVSIPSAVGTLTREQAFAGSKGMLGLFAYTAPRIFFTASEQALLGGGADRPHRPEPQCAARDTDHRREGALDPDPASGRRCHSGAVSRYA